MQEAPTQDPVATPSAGGEALNKGMDSQARATEAVAQAEANLALVGEGPTINDRGEVETRNDRLHDLKYRQDHDGQSSAQLTR